MKQILIYNKNNKPIVKRKHHNPNNWITIYYFKKKTLINKDKVIHVLDKCGSYQKDTFYKIQSLSNKDKIFDYYRVLKKNDNKELLIEIDSDDENITEEYLKEISQNQKIEKKEKSKQNFKSHLTIKFN